ncbi:MAG: CAP domain-containing protein [Pseudomonadota bacterium]
MLSYFALIFGGIAAFAFGSGGGSSGGSSSSDDDTSGSAPSASGGTPVSSFSFAPSSAGLSAPEEDDDVSIGEDVPRLEASAYELDWAGLSDEEQYMVELVNRARMDPTGEVGRAGDGLASGVSSSPVQPLAVTHELSDASREHSQDMDNRDFFAHTNPSNQSPADRAVEEGHGSRFVGENIGWIGSSRSPNGEDAQQSRAENHHNNLWESDGHQVNLMRDFWTEIGLGYDYGSTPYTSPQTGQTFDLDGSTWATQMFSDRGENYLTGVVYDDEDENNSYDMGEGQGGVRITAYDGETSYGTSTWGSGGYSLALPPGTYRVIFEGGELDQPFETVVSIGDENVKVDVIEDDVAARTLASIEFQPTAADDVVEDELPSVPVDEGEAMAEEEDLGDDLLEPILA